MQLANPRTVQTNINDEKRKDIDNGITLARRVDTLRETIVKEEQRLELFRTSTVKIVQEEIDEKIKEKVSLGIEVHQLEDKRKELLKPLDKEWEEVKNEKIILESQKSMVLSEKKLATKLLNLSQEKLLEVKEDEERIVNLKLQAKEELSRAHGTSLEAQNCLINARNEETRITSHVKKEQEKLNEKEAILQATVNYIAIRENNIKEDEKFIAEEKIRLAHMRLTLERALARTIK